MSEVQIANGAVLVAEQQVAVEKYGARYEVPKGQLSAPTAARVEANITRKVDRSQGYAGVVEIPGTRAGVWEYREHYYSIDPAAVLAYVGDATGAEAVRLSNQMLDSLAAAMERRR